MFYRLGKNCKGAGNHSPPPPSAPLYVQGLTSLGDNIQPNCGFIDPSLTFLQSYVIEECALQVTAGEQNKNSQAIYCSGHLRHVTMVKGGLVALQSPTSTNSVETRDAFQTTLPALLQDRDGWRDRLMNARASSTWWWCVFRRRCVG